MGRIGYDLKWALLSVGNCKKHDTVVPIVQPSRQEGAPLFSLHNRYFPIIWHLLGVAIIEDLCPLQCGL